MAPNNEITPDAGGSSHARPPWTEKRFWWPARPSGELDSDLQRLRAENERLRNELRDERMARLRFSLAWHEERQRRLRGEAEAVARYRDFAEWFDTAAFPMTCIGQDGVIEHANNSQLALLGYSRNEYVGHPVGEFFCEREAVEAIMGAVSDGEPVRNCSATIRCKSGDSKLVLLRTEPFRQGVVHGVCCYIFDTSEVRQSRAQLDETLKNLPALVWEMRIDPESGRLRQVYCSDYAEVMLGFPKEAFMERPGLWQERIYPEDQERVIAEMSAIFAGADIEPVQFRWIARDGRIIWIDSTKQVFHDQSGKPIGLRGVALDITERKREEAKRQQVEERFHDMLKNLPAVVWESRVDPVSRTVCPVFVSDYAETLLGFPKEQWFKTNLWLDRIHPDDRLRVKRRVEETFDKAEPGAEQFRWIARDGRTIWIESRKSVVRDRAGRPVGIRGVNIDITEQKRAEAEREATELRFQAFMNNSPVAALMKDEKGHFVYGNRVFIEWCKRLGLHWKGLTDFEIFPADLARRYIALDRKALEKNETTQTLEITYEKGGVPRYWTVLRFPITDPQGGRLLGIVAMEVTERRRLEKEIVEISDREQRRFGRELHDGLCQHLLGIALMSKTLAGRMAQNGLPEAKEVQTLSDFLYDALGLARGLMQGLHLVNIAAAGGLPGALEEFCNTTARLFNKSCRFESRVEIEVTDIDFATHLFRIAQEATHNAMKHGEPTEVTILLDRLDDRTLLLKVENDGKSLPDLDPDAEGIGIRTMKYRADLIGGELRLEDRPEGGVTVSCRVPVGHGVDFSQ